MQLIIIVLVILMCFKLFRCIVFNLHNIVINGFMDIYLYFKYKKWEEFNYFGIDLFCGYFGKGKTLSVVIRANQLYQKYGDEIKFLSNIHLTNIPYEKLTNFKQIEDLQEVNDGRKGTIVILDEVQTLLSHRNYANFPLTLLNVICQPRKCNVYIMCTAQRFFMVDKIFRSLIKNVYDCNKIWRIQHCIAYDGWDYEQSMNTKLIKRIGHYYTFVKNKHYSLYDTCEQITSYNADDFISNVETLGRIGENVSNPYAVVKPSHKMKKILNK